MNIRILPAMVCALGLVICLSMSTGANAGNLQECREKFAKNCVVRALVGFAEEWIDDTEKYPESVVSKISSMPPLLHKLASLNLQDYEQKMFRLIEDRSETDELRSNRYSYLIFVYLRLPYYKARDDGEILVEKLRKSVITELENSKYESGELADATYAIQVWGNNGLRTGMEEYAAEITGEFNRPYAFANAAKHVIDGRSDIGLHMFDLALEYARALRNPVQRQIALSYVAKTLSGKNRIDKAVQIVSEIEDGIVAAETLVDVLYYPAIRGIKFDGKHLARAYDVVASAFAGKAYDRAVYKLAAARIAVGDPETYADLSDGIRDPGLRLLSRFDSRRSTEPSESSRTLIQEGIDYVSGTGTSSLDTFQNVIRLTSCVKPNDEPQLLESIITGYQKHSATLLQKPSSVAEFSRFVATLAGVGAHEAASRIMATNSDPLYKALGHEAIAETLTDIGDVKNAIAALKKARQFGLEIEDQVRANALFGRLNMLESALELTIEQGAVLLAQGGRISESVKYLEFLNTPKTKKMVARQIWLNIAAATPQDDFDNAAEKLKIHVESDLTYGRFRYLLLQGDIGQALPLFSELTAAQKMALAPTILDIAHQMEIETWKKPDNTPVPLDGYQNWPGNDVPIYGCAAKPVGLERFLSLVE